MYKHLKMLIVVIFITSAAFQVAAFASEKSEMDDSVIPFFYIPFYGAPSLSQDVLIPSKAAEPQSLRIHIEKLIVPTKQSQEYSKTHSWPWANYVMYGVLQIGTGTNQSSQIIWGHYQYFSDFSIENGLYSLYRAVWNPYRNCVDIVFAQYRAIGTREFRRGLTIELYEAKLTDNLHVTTEELLKHEPDFLSIVTDPVATLKTNLKDAEKITFAGIQRLQLLPEKNSLLLSFDNNSILPLPYYFRYNFESTKWTTLDYEEKAPLPSPAPIKF